MTRTSLFAVFQTAWSCTGKDEEEEMVKKKKRRDTEKEREVVNQVQTVLIRWNNLTYILMTLFHGFRMCVNNRPLSRI